MWVYEAPPPVLDEAAVAEVKERLCMEQVAERYGFTVERGKIVCPFHRDTRPSCFVYPGTRGFYCFACGVGGDVVHFAACLFGLSYREAAARLDADFGFGLLSGVRDDAAILAMQKRRIRAAQEAESRAHRERLFAQRVKALRELPVPTTHEQAAVYGALQGELAMMEYLIEESVYPEG